MVAAESDMYIKIEASQWKVHGINIFIFQFLMKQQSKNNTSLVKPVPNFL